MINDKGSECMLIDKWISIAIHLDKLFDAGIKFLFLPHYVGSGFCTRLQLSILLRQSLIVVQQLAHLGL